MFININNFLVIFASLACIEDTVKTNCWQIAVTKYLRYFAFSCHSNAHTSFEKVLQYRSIEMLTFGHRALKYD